MNLINNLMITVFLIFFIFLENRLFSNSSNNPSLNSIDIKNLEIKDQHGEDSVFNFI